MSFIGSIPKEIPTVSIEAKWKANLEKVEFLKRFPGRLTTWEEASSRTIESVIHLRSRPHTRLLLFTDGSFAITPELSTEPQELTDVIREARGILEARHPSAYAEYDRLDQRDKEAGRLARMHNILAAIRNNLEQMPELKGHLRSLVRQWEQEP